MTHFPALADCLETIRRREAALQAWVVVAPQAAAGNGPLHGVPVGIKDIYDVRGMATRHGSPVFRNAPVAEKDAALTQLLREKGAIIVGKTHTTAFAYFDSAPTRNPLNPAHTPGGSSSGSAAAVSAGMTPFATGSQTQGSVIRPASFCGCVGFKPTHGLLPLEGCLRFAETLDTAGFFARSVKDMRWLWEAIGYAKPARWTKPRIAAFPVEEVVTPEMRRRFEETVAQLGVRTIEPPERFTSLFQVVKLIQDTEGARNLRAIYEQHGQRVGVKLAEMIERGLQTPEATYRDGLAMLRAAREEMKAIFAEWDVILTPAALGAAPEGFATTGDPRLNAPWTGLGTPALSVPMTVGARELPLGLQLAAAPGADSELLSAGVEIEAALSHDRSR